MLKICLGIKSETSFNNCIINGDITTVNDIIINNSTLTATNLNSIKSQRGNITINNSTIKDSDGHGIYTTGSNVEVSLQYSFVKDNDGIGIYTTGNNAHVNLSSSMVTGNDSYGIQSSGQVNTNYSNITFNEDDGVYLTGNNFSNIKNSIIWGNDIVNYTQINTGSGVTSITYSTVQGSGAYGTSGGQYYFGDGSIDDDPVFADITVQETIVDLMDVVFDALGIEWEEEYIWNKETGQLECVRVVKGEIKREHIVESSDLKPIKKRIPEIQKIINDRLNASAFMNTVTMNGVGKELVSIQTIHCC